MCKYRQKITKCHVGLLGCFSSLLQPDNAENVIKTQWQMFIRCSKKKKERKKTPNKINRRHSKQIIGGVATLVSNQLVWMECSDFICAP